VHVFKCNWVNANVGVCQDKMGFTLVGLQKMPFINAKNEEDDVYTTHNDHDEGPMSTPPRSPPPSNAHSGLGVVWNKEEGFVEDDFVVDFLGENALLASIAENEKQTEMAARVSTWKQRIENNLEEQESHPPFDIQDYGERVLHKKVKEKAAKLGKFFPKDLFSRSRSKNVLAMTFRQVVLQQIWSFVLTVFQPGEERKMVDLETPREVPASFALSSTDEYLISVLSEAICISALQSTQIQPSIEKYGDKICDAILPRKGPVTGAMSKRLQEDWARVAEEGPRVLMNLRVDF
ncbi:Condensin-2 complex subunit H2, partial [Glycine soja]